jgi:hypothetical protein
MPARLAARELFAYQRTIQRALRLVRLISTISLISALTIAPI